MKTTSPTTLKIRRLARINEDFLLLNTAPVGGQSSVPNDQRKSGPGDYSTAGNSGALESFGNISDINFRDTSFRGFLGRSNIGRLTNIKKLLDEELRARGTRVTVALCPPVNDEDQGSIRFLPEEGVSIYRQVILEDILRKRYSDRLSDDTSLPPKGGNGDSTTLRVGGDTILTLAEWLFETRYKNYWDKRQHPLAESENTVDPIDVEWLATMTERLTVNSDKLGIASDLYLVIIAFFATTTYDELFNEYVYDDQRNPCLAIAAQRLHQLPAGAIETPDILLYTFTLPFGKTYYIRSEYGLDWEYPVITDIVSPDVVCPEMDELENATENSGIINVDHRNTINSFIVYVSETQED